VPRKELSKALLLVGLVSVLAIVWGTVAASQGQASAPFTGVWEGIDPGDGSRVTLRLTQQGNRLAGFYEDTFSQSPGRPKIAPGYRG